MIGETINHYKILEKLGEGGMGVVYMAQDTRLGRTVAIKFLSSSLPADGPEKARFVHEARSAAALDHPNICTVHEIGDFEGGPYIVMAYVEGMSLSEKIAGRPLELEEAMTFAMQLGRALQEAHSHHVFHRDIKSANAMVSKKGHAILTDFGLATFKGQTRHTRPGTTVGTVGYMSPEQSRGQDADARSDIWSLGVVLYEMVAGRVPFEGEHEAAVMYSIMNEPHAPLTSLRTGVPLELERIVDKALTKDPDQRYQHADEMVVDLKAVRESLRVHGTGTSRSGGTGAGSAPAAESASDSKKASLRRRWMVAAAVVVIVSAALWWQTTRNSDGPGGPDGATKITRLSVAVLPLESMSEDDSRDYFADGMTEALIAQLARVRELKVTSRTSVMRFQGTDRPIREIAEELGVANIVEGSVLLAGNEVRITAQLIDGRTDEHLWASSYDGKIENVLSLQSQVARAIANEIEATLDAGEPGPGSTRPVNPEAYDLYLRGRYLWNRRTVPDIRKAIEYFEQAIELDPGYAAAYAATAQAYTVLATWAGGGGGAGEFNDTAKAWAEKALALDPDLAEAHAVLSGVAMEYEWEWEAAERHTLRAIELNPGDATTRQWYAEHLAALGRLREAREQIDIALELDPLSLIVNVVSSFVYLVSGDLDRARTEIERVMDLDPQFLPAQAASASIYRELGMHDEQVEHFCRYIDAAQPNRTVAPGLREAYAQSGIEGFYRQRIAMARPGVAAGAMSPLIIMGDFACLGEVDSTLHWLEISYEQRAFRMHTINAPHQECFDEAILTHPRFIAILEKMNLAPRGQ